MAERYDDLPLEIRRRIEEDYPNTPLRGRSETVRGQNTEELSNHFNFEGFQEDAYGRTIFNDYVDSEARVRSSESQPRNTRSRPDSDAMYAGLSDAQRAEIDAAHTGRRWDPTLNTVTTNTLNNMMQPNFRQSESRLTPEEEAQAAAEEAEIQAGAREREALYGKYHDRIPPSRLGGPMGDTLGGQDMYGTDPYQAHLDLLQNLHTAANQPDQGPTTASATLPGTNRLVTGVIRRGRGEAQDNESEAVGKQGSSSFGEMEQVIESLNADPNDRNASFFVTGPAIAREWAAIVRRDSTPDNLLAAWLDGMADWIALDPRERTFGNAALGSTLEAGVGLGVAGRMATLATRDAVEVGRGLGFRTTNETILGNFMGAYGARITEQNTGSDLASRVIARGNDLEARGWTEAAITRELNGMLSAGDRTGALGSARRNAVGEWLVEINSSNATIQPTVIQRVFERGNPIQNTELGTILDYPAYYAAFPDARNISTTIIHDPTRRGALYDRASNRMIVYARDAEDARSSIIHELEHHGQGTEGRPSGADSSDTPVTSMMLRRLTNGLEQSFLTAMERRAPPWVAEKVESALIRAMNEHFGLDFTNISGRPGFTGSTYADVSRYFASNPSINNQVTIQALTGRLNHILYEVSAGEVEARIAQARLRMTAQQRREEWPSSNEQNIPNDEQIIRPNAAEVDLQNMAPPTLSSVNQLNAVTSRLASRDPGSDLDRALANATVAIDRDIASGRIPQEEIERITTQMQEARDAIRMMGRRASERLNQQELEGRTGQGRIAETTGLPDRRSEASRARMAAINDQGLAYRGGGYPNNPLPRRLLPEDAPPPPRPIGREGMSVLYTDERVHPILLDAARQGMSNILIRNLLQDRLGLHVTPGRINSYIAHLVRDMQARAGTGGD